MAWFQELAGKAEDFLNKVDQGAAEVLTKEKLSRHDGYLSVPEVTPQRPTSLTSSISIPGDLPSYGDWKSSVTSFSPSGRSTPTRRATNFNQDTDAQLLEFLNSDKNLESPITPRDITSAASTPSIAEMEKQTDDCKEKFSDNNLWSTSLRDSAVDVRSIEMENHLLSNEVKSLNQEMKTLLARAKYAEAEVTRLQEQAVEWSTQGNMVLELKSQQVDQVEVLKAKDSQLAVLRVRLDESDQEVHALKNQCNKLKQENKRILDDSTNSSGLHSQAVQNMQEKVDEMQGQLKREQEKNRSTLAQLTSRIHQLEDEQNMTALSLSESEKKLNEERKVVGELNTQLGNSRNLIENAREDLKEYKAKAQRILQSKEKVIATLKDATAGEEDQVRDMEIEQLKQERDLVREELSASQHQIEQLRVDVSEIESQLAVECERVSEANSHSDEEARKRQQAEQECKQQTEELKFWQEELSRQKVALSSRVKEREEEIERLRSQLTAKQISTHTNDSKELENRIHALTDSLLHKQTLVETLSTEKSSLVAQLERMERQLHHTQSVLAGKTSHAVNINDTDDAKVRSVPGWMLESPWDGGVTRRVKRAYSSIDTFSIRLGVFLRRYPIARVFIILYMFMLHLWVMIVLLTYTPEIHPPDYNPNHKL